jgi:microcystin degradation protein MlrC
LYRLCVAAAREEIRPVMRAVDCRMTGLFPTSYTPMRDFVDEMKRERTGNVLSTSLIHGFPWGDVADAGVKCLAISHDDPALAEQTARSLAERFWSIREAVQISALHIDDAIDEALACPDGPVVLADVADNAGGGAPSDSTFILRRLLERNVDGVVSGVYYDPIAVELCFEAGEDAVLDLRCGGKLGAASGMPLDLRVRVRKLSEHHTQSSMDDSAPVALGRAAWVDAGTVHLVLASIRSQVFAPDAFSALGISLDDARIVVVKSSHHFWAKFAPIAGAVFHVDSPGALQLDFSSIPYVKRSRNYWPRVADPFSSA